MHPTAAMRAVISRRLSYQGGGGAAQAVDPFKHCADVVRRGDYDGYLCSLLQGSERRQAAFAVRAFNVETAAIKDSVRGNVMPGRMRMQWWKDVLGDIFAGDPPPQPVALALADVVARQKGGLTRRWFDRVLDARMADLETSQPLTVNEMEIYAENTASSLLYLSLEIADVRSVANGGGKAVAGVNEVGHAASHVGKALGICVRLRSLGQPPPASTTMTSMGGNNSALLREPCVIPSELMRKNRLVHSVLQRGPKTSEEAHALTECVFELASVAKGHMDAAEEGLAAAREKVGNGGSKLPARAFAALLPGVRAAWYLDTLEKCQFDVFDARLRPRSPLGFQLRLGRAVLAEKFQ